VINSVKDIRELAVRAAYEQFEATGSISMRMLGASLDVSAAAIYHHFANKQALLNAVADRAFGVFEKQLRSIEARDPRQTIHAILDAYRQFAAGHPKLFGLMFVEPVPTPRRFPRDFAAHRSAVFNILWKAVEECVADNADGTSDEALYLAHDLWSLAHGQILLWRAGRFEDDQTFERSFYRSIERFISTL
jgi:AcrR family transcriptional regulator